MGNTNEVVGGGAQGLTALRLAYRAGEYTQRELAEAVGRERATISRWLSGVIDPPSSVVEAALRWVEQRRASRSGGEAGSTGSAAGAEASGGEAAVVVDRSEGADEPAREDVPVIEAERGAA